MNTEGAARRTVVRAVAIGVASSLAVLAFDLVWVEEPGQVWPVRWLRLAAEHPLRMGLAGAGLCLACSRSWCPDSPPEAVGTSESK
jgi:hypothetical protein